LVSTSEHIEQSGAGKIDISPRGSRVRVTHELLQEDLRHPSLRRVRRKSVTPALIGLDTHADLFTSGEPDSALGARRPALVVLDPVRIAEEGRVPSEAVSWIDVLREPGCYVGVERERPHTTCLRVSEN
jgi:hypothetical protein